MTIGKRRAGESHARRVQACSQLREFLLSRSSLPAMAFSLAVHAVIFLAWPGLPRHREAARRPIMVARLLPGGDAVPSAGGGQVPPAGESEMSATPAEDEDAAPAPAAAARGGGGGAGAAARTGTAAARRGDPPSVSAAGGASSLSPRHHAAAELRVPAAAGPGPGQGEAVREMLAEIRERIESRKTYPRLARRNGWEGMVLVELDLGGDGALQAVQVIEPSAYPLLDRATLAAVRRAGPFPPLPGRVRVPVSYRLSGE